MVSRGSGSNKVGGGPQAVPDSSVMNNFVGGLKTEFTGLNFPENACTSTENCVFTLIGDVTRRPGIDFELNGSIAPYAQLGLSNTTGLAINTYRWTNVGGDGQTQILVVQVGSMIFFYQNTNATITSPLSTTLLSATVNLNGFTVQGSPLVVSATECQFTDGNGYLFIFNPACESLYCTFNAGSIITAAIQVSIRDFQGIPEPGVAVNFRPGILTAEHNYNLNNQGWAATPSVQIFGASGTFPSFNTNGPNTYPVTFPTGLTLTIGGSYSGAGRFTWNGGPVDINFSGTLSSYSSSTGAASIFVGSNSFSGHGVVPNTGPWNIVFAAAGTITTWFSAEANYPSNADIWFAYKNSSGVFAPSTTLANVSQPVAQSPQGSYILSAFTQTRSSISGIQGLADVRTPIRPRAGTWFQGRLWLTGVDASQQATGDEPYYTWTENLYFSQIITDPTQFGNCYQANDPTSETLFNLLPSDGGVITIQGSGSIYKLVPVQNGMLVFAANGIWFITGSQGIGFTATDYVITKVSNVQSISSTSYINLYGTILFWNEEGIWTVASTQGPDAQAPLGLTHGGLAINNICLGSILTFYQQIPLQSKKFVKVDYNPITYTMRWIYRSTNDSGPSNRWQYDSVLNYNTVRQAFYPYQILNTTPSICGINYVAGPGGSTSPSPAFKFLTATPTGITFSEERDTTNWVDFFSFDGVGVNYVSTFTSGYNNRSQFLTKIQPLYLYVYSRGTNTQYQVQSIFDFATDPQSGKYSQSNISIDQNQSFLGMVRKRHRIRGNGYTYQILVTSVSGQPFDIMGWTLFETRNAGV